MNLPEDYFTRTISDAAAYERWRTKNDPDYYERDERDEECEDYDRCGCSDPCCPCEGPK